jgi:hypothetical protein
MLTASPSFSGEDLNEEKEIRDMLENEGQFHEQMLAYAMKDLSKGKRPGDVALELVRKGTTVERAETIAAEANGIRLGMRDAALRSFESGNRREAVVQELMAKGATEEVAEAIVKVAETVTDDIKTEKNVIDGLKGIGLGLLLIVIGIVTGIGFNWCGVIFILFGFLMILYPKPKRPQFQKG